MFVGVVVGIHGYGVGDDLSSALGAQLVSGSMVGAVLELMHPLVISLEPTFSVLLGDVEGYPLCLTDMVGVTIIGSLYVYGQR